MSMRPSPYSIRPCHQGGRDVSRPLNFKRILVCDWMLRLRPATSSNPLDCSGGVFDWDVALRRLDELNARVEDPTLWDNPEMAQGVMRERTRLGNSVDAVKKLEQELKDALDYAELADMEGDEELLEEARAMLKSIKDYAGRAELEALLSGEADGNDAYLEINSGAGGPNPATGPVY